jgi:hypothetical protein
MVCVSLYESVVMAESGDGSPHLTRWIFWDQHQRENLRCVCLLNNVKRQKQVRGASSQPQQLRGLRLHRCPTWPKVWWRQTLSCLLFLFYLLSSPLLLQPWLISFLTPVSAEMFGWCAENWTTNTNALGAGVPGSVSNRIHPQALHFLPVLSRVKVANVWDQSWVQEIKVEQVIPLWLTLPSGSTDLGYICSGSGTSRSSLSVDTIRRLVLSRRPAAVGIQDISDTV